MAIDLELMALFTADKITFVQFYVDSLHFHILFSFKHPASGATITCGKSHHQFEKVMLENRLDGWPCPLTGKSAGTPCLSLSRILSRLLTTHPLSLSPLSTVMKARNCITCSVRFSCCSRTKNIRRKLSVISEWFELCAPFPLKNWTQDLKIIHIKQMFPLSDALGAGPAVVGEALLMVLLEDIFQRN